jgi:hypothetical protein
MRYEEKFTQQFKKAQRIKRKQFRSIYLIPENYLPA